MLNRLCRSVVLRPILRLTTPTPFRALTDWSLDDESTAATQLPQAQQQVLATTSTTLLAISPVDESNSMGLFSMVSSFFSKVVTVGIGLAVIAAGILYVKQESLLYFPVIGGMSRDPSGNPKGFRSPEERKIPYETHTITTQDGVQIHSWLLLSDPQAPTLIFFHGNAGNVGFRLPNAKQMRKYLGVNILMVEYRGYGASDSVTPNEQGIKLDSEAALRYCHTLSNIDTSKLFLFGRSLGGAVAFHLADYAQRENIPLAGVIVENTFTSISDMVDVLLPFLTPIKRFVLRIGWNSLDIVPKLRIPTLYLAGGRDELVPHGQMLQLYDEQKRRSGASRVEMHVIANGSHNESWMQGGVAYWDAIKDYLTAVTGTLGQEVCETDVGDNMNEPEGSIPMMANNLMDMAQGNVVSDKKKD